MDKSPTYCKYLSLFCLMSVPLISFGFDAEQFFENKCASCHTIGGGDDVGPDLKDVTKRREQKWVMRFIRESQTVIQEGDPVAVEMFQKFKNKKMPDQILADDEMLALLALIESGKAGASAQKMKSATEATPQDVIDGKAYFTGTTRLSKGGTACIACHSAGDIGALGGGKLGPDLTLAYSTYNDQGLSKVMTRISFPSMIEVYKGKELTADEVFKIKAFLFQADREGVKETGDTKKFFFLGIAGFLLVLGLFDLIWKGRRKKTRRPM